MDLKGRNICFGITGSFYSFKNVILQIKKLVKIGANIIPIMSYNAYNTDTKYGKAENFRKQIIEITKNDIIHTLNDTAKIRNKNSTDIMIIAPCTGNTIAKLSSGISDSPVLVVAKKNLKINNPLVIAPYTTDGLSRKCRKYWKTTQ